MRGELRVYVPHQETVAVSCVLTGPPSLAELQAHVGGYLELVPYFIRFRGTADEEWRRAVVYCDEDGKNKRLPVNRAASERWYDAVPEARGRDVLVGPVVVITGDDELFRAMTGDE